MKPNRSFLPLALVFIAVVLAGCPSQTLQSGTTAAPAAYTDTTLFDADLVANGAGDTFTTFVNWEHQSRATLAVVPQIRKLSDQVNLNAKQWLKSYFSIRDAYAAAAPADKAKYNLANALAPIQAALAQVAVYMIKPPAAAPTPAAPTS